MHELSSKHQEADLCPGMCVSLAPWHLFRCYVGKERGVCVTPVMPMHKPPLLLLTLCEPEQGTSAKFCSLWS